MHDSRNTLSLAVLAALFLTGCQSESQIESGWAAESEFGFTTDAEDPMVARKREGSLLFTPDEGPEGTASPLDPDNRKHGFGKP